MGRRTLLLITSILIAAVGTALVAIYVRGADERAAAGADLVTVLVAKQRVAAGTPVQQAVDQQSFATERVLQRERVADAFTSVTQLQSRASDGDVALGQILPGQIIQAAMFGEAGAATASGLTGEQMRLAVQLNDPNRSAGFLQSGQDVAVFLTTGEGPAQRTGLLLPKVRVLSVGATVQAPARGTTGETSAGDATSAAEDAVPTTIVSVAVNQDEAQKLIFSQKAGELYFAILQPGKQAAPGKGPIGIGDVIGQP
jgi:pilus assembly protein CpaB